ncbi:hypothetical protein FB567DRAFT_546164 [Paraphoma chrysanthemicola]|uniref:Uncharacterized protein n=1 Tax=Paraphoma chrysanthemicola TaxID=798071 RepID=A0A8K0REN0_9PLEO|nr:hypothetical protein FB567DRAFT_546164 [Paraphoma chrysanthemicola]
MSFKSLKRLFTRRRGAESHDPHFLDQSQDRAEMSRPNRERVDSVGSCESSCSETSCIETVGEHNLLACLPHTFVTSNLADKDRSHRLVFSHFLAEDPGIAVFSKSQDAAVPTAWRHSRSWRTWVGNICYGVRKGYISFRPCDIWVIVGFRWQYKISPRAIRYWSATAGLLLVDWNTMYDDYFAQERKKKNQKRTHDIVKKFRRLEKKTLRNETGAIWKAYGDWDICAPTAADVALACRYEGQGFERGLAPLYNGISIREVRSLVKQLKDAFSKELGRRIAQQKELWRYGRKPGSKGGRTRSGSGASRGSRGSRRG